MSVPGGSSDDLQSFLLDDSFWKILYAILEFCHDVAVKVPVTFRASGIVLLFMFGWGLNVIGMDSAGLPWRTVLGVKTNEGKAKDVFLGVGYMSVLLVMCYMIYRGCHTVEFHVGENLAQIAFWVLLVVMVWTSSTTIFKDCRSFLLQRVVTLVTASEVKFVDVLFADALTSVSKLLADSQVIVCSVAFAILGQSVFTACSASVVGPILASIPYAIRAFQCWLTYSKKGDQMQLINLGKYLSSFPVIWTSALKYNLEPSPDMSEVEQNEYRQYDEYLEVLWMYTVVINTIYSFLWDIYMDWGLGRPRSSTGKRQWPFLRPTLVYQWASLYYIIMPMDLALRATWSLKLSSHLQEHASGQTWIVLFEVLEVFRRWGWIFFRVEWECISKKVLPGQQLKAVTPLRSSVNVDAVAMDGDQPTRTGSLAPRGVSNG